MIRAVQQPVLPQRLGGQRRRRVEVRGDPQIIHKIPSGRQSIGVNRAEAALVQGVSFFTQRQCLSVVPGFAPGDGKLFRRPQCAGVDHPQDRNITVKGGLKLIPRLPVLSGFTDVPGITVFRLESERVLVAENPAACLQNRGIELRSPAVITHQKIIKGEVVRRHERPWMLVAEHPHVAMVEILVE